MSLDELVVPNPRPANLDMPVRCRHCLHFARTPYYRIAGTPTVCSHETKIGRKPGDVPCPNFSLDTQIMRDLKPATKLLIGQLAAQLQSELGTTRKGVEGLLTLSMVLRHLYTINRAGLELNREYTVVGRELTGRLIAYNGTQSTIETELGLPYTVLTKDLAPVPRTPAVPRRPSART